MIIVMLYKRGSLVSFAFVFISKAVPQAAKPLEVPTTARPEIWLDPLLEWGVFISVLAWMLSIAIYLKKNLKKQN